MLKFKKQKLLDFKKSLMRDNNDIKIYKNKKITTPILNKEVYIYNGLFFVKRKIVFFFINRYLKFNTLFKKPLVKPLKKNKKN